MGIPITKDLLTQCKFKYEEFPDGFFWYLSPQDDNEKTRLARAIGLCQYDEYDCPDTVILQCDSSFQNWTYVCDGNVDQLNQEEIENILQELIQEPA